MLRRPLLVVALVLLGAAPLTASAAAAEVSAAPEVPEVPDAAPAPDPTAVPEVLAPAAYSVVATPSSGLVDGQRVLVSADGFEPGRWVEIFECAGDAVDEQRCDPRVAFGEFDVDAAGHFEFVDFPVDARIYLGPSETSDVEYDCRTEPAGCKIGVGLMLDHSVSAFAAIEFDPSAPLLPPVSATVSPSTGLQDGQTVTVDGANLTDFEGTWIFQCRTGDGPRACDHDRSFYVEADPDGTMTTDYTLRAEFTSPLGEHADCRSAPGACSIVVSWGFAFVADRLAEVPLTFATVPTTSAPTTAPPVTTATTVAPAELPRTGASPSLVWLAVVLLGFGGALLLAARRIAR